MQKLVDLSRKKPIIGIFIRLVCWILFKVMSCVFGIKSFLRQRGIGGKAYNSLLEFKNKAKRKRCFIICTGPSLTVKDCESLSNEDTFAMNSIMKLFDQTSFRPTYYGVQDVNVYEKLQEEIEAYFGESKNVFVADRISKSHSINKNWNIFPLEYTYGAYGRWFKNQFQAKFSDDPYAVVYDGFSITMALIQIAVYMGYKEIYLLGADCSFTDPNKLHFADYGVADSTIDTARERNLAGYRASKEYADKHGIEIYNATRGGALEVFERRNLDDVLTERFT